MPRQVFIPTWQDMREARLCESMAASQPVKNLAFIFSTRSFSFDSTQLFLSVKISRKLHTPFISFFGHINTLITHSPRPNWSTRDCIKLKNEVSHEIIRPSCYRIYVLGSATTRLWTDHISLTCSISNQRRYVRVLSSQNSFICLFMESGSGVITESKFTLLIITGTAIDQGIAYTLLMVALAVTYLLH